MNNNKTTNKRCVDIIIFIAFIIIVVGGYLLDKSLSNYLPKWILIDSSMKDDLKLSVFSAQVSISTLGIALVAILGGLFKEEIYGVNVLRYLTNDKPLIFKHKINIIVQLALIFISYICVSFDNYNMLISIFSISIMITIIMVIDIFNVFKGNEYLRNEIYNYILRIFNKNKLHKNNLHQSTIVGLKNDTLINIENNNTSMLKENLDLFNKILETITNYNEEDKKIILDLFEDSLSDIFNKIFEEKNPNKVIIALKTISKLYNTCNNSNRLKGENKTYIDIYERVYYRIFSAIATVLIEDREDQYIIINLQYDLYNNMNFKEMSGNMVPQNNTYLSLYSGRIYYEIKRKGFENYNIEAINNLKKKLFTTLQSYIQYYKFDEFKIEKINQIYIQLYEYTKILIDNNEKDLLNNVFFKNIDNIYNSHDTKHIEYVFIMIIYIYYLTEFEGLVDKKFRYDIVKLVKHNKDYIYNFLMCNDNFKFNKRNIENIKMILSRWEKMPEEEAKCMIMDNVIEKFILLYILEKNWNSESLINELIPLVEGNEFSISSDLDNRKDILQLYIRFNILFFKKEISKEEAEDKINMLKYAINILYKEAELKKSKKEIKTEEEYNIIKNNIRDKTLENLNKKLERFNNKINAKTFYENIQLLNLETITDFLDDDGIDKIIDINESSIIRYIVFIINEKLEKDDIFKSDKNLLVRFFELYDKIGFKTDTLIGYRDYFYGINDIDKFKEFEQNKIKLKSSYSKDCIITIDSSKFYFNINNILVEIKNMDIDEVCKELNLNENGEYLYNITNDIYIPFTKDELKIYLDNKKRNITIKADIEYSFKDEYIGSGIFLR
ncbi:hypothetical protein [Clostridium baratii]|uniref:hypothetical protein n=1 Tax=Clostridium baratii TaxID=1561 RepID=UPI0005F2DBD1|nr:hypothetical protein [Clostridium baratii]KJU71145.1 hypothetical protein UC77_11245 [Clostridium baratii]